VLATTILLETWTIERFAAAGHGHLASYARCGDSLRTRNGNKYLAWAFVEAANFALRFSTEAKRF